MIAVIDASAAVGLVLGAAGTELFHAVLAEADLVIAPDLFVAEVANTLWKYRKTELLSTGRCEQALEQALQLADRIEPGNALHVEAFALACRYRHPVYDALYLVLARRNNATLLTLDRRLAILAQQLGIAVVVPG